jgi:hypothetical protein
LLFLFLGGQQRYFARWLLPAYPAIVFLAAYGAVRLAGRRPGLLVAVAVLLVAQGLASTVRVDAVLARTDTRALAREWIVDEIPAGAGLVVEPFVPGGWTPESYRVWEVKRPFQAHEKRLHPGLIDEYRSGGYCWIVVASHQRGRGLKARLANAKAYYGRLDFETERRIVFSPWRANADPPEFSFDMSFNNYPPEHARPGPLVEVHKLEDCK